MPSFVKAIVAGIQNQPIINAVIDGGDIMYREYIDISIVVGTPKGLVVLVICDVDRMNFADIEKIINTLAKKANDRTISIDEMIGGLFMISNGGVYGYLLSTPVINPPQSEHRAWPNDHRDHSTCPIAICIDHPQNPFTYHLTLASDLDNFALPKQNFVGLIPFEKNFYRESPTVLAMSESEVATYRRMWDIMVDGGDVPKLIRSLRETRFPGMAYGSKGKIFNWYC